METVGVFDIFKIGVGPSSSHTMGPWRAAQRFLQRCRSQGGLGRVRRVRVDLYGSLAKTGKGHGTDVALMMGLCDLDPVTCETAEIHPHVREIRRQGELLLGGERTIPFLPDDDIVFHPDVSPPAHPNTLTITAALEGGGSLAETYHSIGGGFVITAGEGQGEGEGEGDSGGAEARSGGKPSLPYPAARAAEVLEHCRREGLSIAELAWRNECAGRAPALVRAGLERIWTAMRDCACRGAHRTGTLPGGLAVVRRAAGLNATLLGRASDAGAEADAEAWLAAVRAHAGGFPEILKWVSCFALAVSEENASFGRVVTAPTNGAAGVIPAVLLYRVCFHETGAVSAVIEPFLLTAGVIGGLFKAGATLSAAMGGCQAEIGVSSAMAAAGLAQSLGGSPERVLMAAEIAMEHHLGLTCDPVGGLVQIPCIERNTMGAVKAIAAALLALESDPARARVSLDAVIRSMWATAQDMSTKYKETAEGGLAIQIPVNLSEC